MRVVYLDVLFALNFAMDYCILRCVSALSGRPAAVWRLSLAAGLGALYAGGCIVIPVLSTLPVRMAAGAVMAGTAFPFGRYACWCGRPCFSCLWPLCLAEQ